MAHEWPWVIQPMLCKMGTNESLLPSDTVLDQLPTPFCPPPRRQVGSVVVQSPSHVRLCNPMDCSPPGSSVHGISQARTQEWVATSFFPGDLPDPRDCTHVSRIGRWILYH